MIIEVGNIILVLCCAVTATLFFSKEIWSDTSAIDKEKEKKKKRRTVHFARENEIIPLHSCENRFNHKHIVSQLHFILERFFTIMEWKINAIQDGLSTRVVPDTIKRKKNDHRTDFWRFKPRFQSADAARAVDFFRMNALEELYVVRNEVRSRLNDLYKRSGDRISNGSDLMRALASKRLPTNLFIQSYEQWFTSNANHFVDAARFRLIPDRELMNIDVNAMMSGYESRRTSVKNLSDCYAKYFDCKSDDWVCISKHEDFVVADDGTWVFPIVKIAKKMIEADRNKEELETIDEEEV